MSENLSYLAKLSGLKHSIGEKIENNSLSSDAAVYGAKSYYDFLKPEASKVKVRACNGTACMLVKEGKELKSDLLKSYKEEEVGTVSCLGHCYKNTAYMTGHEVKTEEDDFINAQSLCDEPILLATPPTINELKKSINETLTKSCAEILEEIKKSKIRGRGGAGFPMAYKLQACMEESSDEKYVVCNADEGDPGSYSDRYLLEFRPDLVLYGLMMSAKIVGAQVGILYIRAEYPFALDKMNETINAWKENGLLGNDILGTGFNFEVFSIKGAGSYVCGEETALLSSLEGQRAEVRVRPPYPTTQGLFNKPTTVNNVETLSNIYSIITKGGEVYSKRGTDKSTGVKLISLNGLFNNPGVYEIDMGTSLEDIISKNGFKEEIKALQIGGPLGGVIPLSKIGDINLDFESLKEQGFLLGHASIVAIPKTFPMIKYIEHLLEFTSDESCGKCVPCRVGSTRGFELVKNSSDAKIEEELFNDLLETMELGSLCALGGGISLPIKNIIKYFPQELKAFFKEQK